MKIKKPRKQKKPRSLVVLDAILRRGRPMRHKTDRRATEKNKKIEED